MTNIKQVGELLATAQKALTQANDAYQELLGGVKEAKTYRNNSNNKLHAGVKFVSEEEGKDVRVALKELLKVDTLRGLGAKIDYSDATIHAILHNADKKVKRDFYESVMKLTK